MTSVKFFLFLKSFCPKAIKSDNWLIVVLLSFLILGILARIVSWSDFFYYDDSYLFALGGKFFAKNFSFSGDLGPLGSWVDFPLYKTGYSLAISLLVVFGIDPLLVGKIISLAASLASIILIWKTARKTLGERESYFAVILFCLSFLAVAVSTLVLSESFALFLLLTTFMFLLNTKHLKFFSGVFFFWTLLTRFELVLVLPAFLFLAKLKKSLRHFIVGFLVPLVLAGIYVAANKLDLSVLWQGVIDVFLGKWPKQFTGVLPLLLFDGVILCLAFYGFFCIKDRSLKIFSLLWILPLFLLYLPRDQFRFFSLLLPPIIMLASSGLAGIFDLFNFKFSSVFQRFALIFLVVLAGLQVYYIFRPWHPPISYEQREALGLKTALEKEPLPRGYVLASIIPEPIYLMTGMSVRRIDPKNLKKSIEEMPEKIALIWDQALERQLPDFASKIDLLMSGQTHTFFRVDEPYYYRGEVIYPISPVKVYLMTKQQLSSLVVERSLTFIDR